MKKITLQVNGKKMDFSEQELTAIVEKHLLSETTQQTTTTKVAQKPTEDAWFEVKPQAIDQNLFEKNRDDPSQEETRLLILEAFEEMKKYPEKYGRNFRTMVPMRIWPNCTAKELKKRACNLGDHNADWVEQALEWAQRIVNGESWESICNDQDTANWYRLVVWKDGYARFVGGSVHCYDYRSASDVRRDPCFDSDLLGYTVPLVVSYDE